MSGRAGRRGLDERGIVMFMVDEQMDSTVGKALLKVIIQSHVSVSSKYYVFPHLYVQCTCTVHVCAFIYTAHSNACLSKFHVLVVLLK